MFRGMEPGKYTQYAVRFTAPQGRGDPRTVRVTPPTDDKNQARQETRDLRDWQKRVGHPVDARLVTQTITISAWK